MKTFGANIGDRPYRSGFKRWIKQMGTLSVIFGINWLSLDQRSLSQAQDNPQTQTKQSSVGREVAIPVHLKDGQEFSIPLEALLAHGKLLFSANWTEQEGGGRPLTKGTGRPLSDPSQPLTGMRAFNRISAPDANSCVACHSVPYGIAGGGGDFVTNVFLLGQRFDFLTFDQADKLPTRGAVDESGRAASLQTAADMRGSTGLFGSGYLEMLARQM